jgi:hypothetical protein
VRGWARLCATVVRTGGSLGGGATAAAAGGEEGEGTASSDLRFFVRGFSGLA